MELTNLSREEKKAYDLEQIDALVQKSRHGKDSGYSRHGD